jgi:hypothetical protein
VQPLLPREATVGEEQDAGQRLGEPAVALGRGDASVIEVQFGGLASRDRTVLRGRELGNRTTCGVGHTGTLRRRV